MAPSAALCDAAEDDVDSSEEDEMDEEEASLSRPAAKSNATTSASGSTSAHGDNNEESSSCEEGEDSKEASTSDDDDVAATGGSLSKKGIFSRSQRSACFGFAAQYFAVGLIYGGLPATLYGFFLGYLNVPAYVYSTVSVVCYLPWSFKFFFGLINDTMPIGGLRRKPYMMIGWSICAVVLLVLSQMGLPPPYWCIDSSTGEYVKTKTLPDGSEHVADPCHPDSAKAGGKYAMLMMLAALGYVIADVAADGLTTEYAKAEPLATRGSTQSTAYLTRTIGQACSVLFVGLCMNGKLYNGSFSWSLSFPTICGAFAIPAALMVPISAWFVVEPRSREGKSLSLGEYLAMCWELLKSRACFFIIIYTFFTPVVSNITTTAAAQVKKEWAGVQNFQNQMFTLVGCLLFASGLLLVKKKFLHASWRKMIAITMITLQVVDSFFSTLTIFDVVRNQYFYLGETVLLELPMAANFVISAFVIVEMADDGNEGMVYGLLTTTGNLGSPFARAVGNQIYGLFQPSLSNSDNYILDTPSFRRTVFGSFALSYSFALSSLAFLYFLPDQKEQAQRWKRTWKRRPVYGVITLTVLSFALVYGLLVNFLSMFPSTMCLKFAGGSGCKDVADTLQSLANGTQIGSNATAALIA